MSQTWSTYIFDTDIPFRDRVLEIFDYQYRQNPVYRRFCESLGVSTGDNNSLDDIPLYPVRGFKETKVMAESDEEAELSFKSSGTSSMQRSVHNVLDASLYKKSILEGIKCFYPLEEMVILGYTPGYNENKDSSLIWMIEALIDQDQSGYSKFLPVGQPISADEIEQIHQEGKKILLFGAAFGLMDYLDEHGPTPLPKGSVIMETGGMKTHRREMTRGEMHRRLAKGFKVDRLQVHSEYGMTEMLSQAYAMGGAWFTPVPWMRVLAKDPQNPMQTLKHNKEGRLGVIDLANVHSCSFLLTGDKGRTRQDEKFQVWGRWNPDNLRGCNFLVDYE